MTFELSEEIVNLEAAEVPQDLVGNVSALGAGSKIAGKLLLQ